MNYFIEMGGVGTGAIAEKSIGKPIYSNGFLLSVGLRVNLILGIAVAAVIGSICYLQAR